MLNFEPVELIAPVFSGFPASTSVAQRKLLIRFERPDFPLMFSGESSLVGGLPYAQCYGGHQFGTWAGQLGDGLTVLQSMRGGGIALWQMILLCLCFYYALSGL
ncbi:hypothetical protein GIB67_009475 [Kingdonia uniflora]|uniref:Selenoprotein O n=1 Tax=Kingdonia uniflora TaxID=39325 RepID=A0A7J7N3A6_9MAGN|nr:hypothetical protein GIB67_009475 [Kingdonia uniflora]